jgi:diguanylate cyclase (GGDEF)-like protein
VPAADGTADEPDVDGPADAAACVAAVGARDVLVFRRVGPGTWAHVGGVGRGAGWAGIVEAEEAGEPMLREALVATAPIRLLAGTPARVVGPYYAGTAVLQRLGDELVVLWGHPARSDALLAATTAELLTVAEQVLRTAEEDGPARRLGDELEVLHAVQRLTAGLGRPLTATLEHVASVAVDALSCSAVAVWVSAGQFAVAQRGEGLRSTTGLDAVLRDLLDTAPRRRVCQDATAAPLPPPLAPGDGVVAYLLQPFGEQLGGGLLAVHRSDAPRGFTSLCRRVAEQITDAAAVLLQVAQARAVLEGQLAEIRGQLGTDALTGVASRHRWDEELSRAQQLVDYGTAVTVALVDLDDLKMVNDTYGHATGDVLLRVCADALAGSLRGATDLVARVGGDEFAVLVPAAADAAGLAARLRAGLEDLHTPDGLPVRASVGAAVCPPAGTVAAAVREADAAMYADKRRRRS